MDFRLHFRFLFLFHSLFPLFQKGRGERKGKEGQNKKIKKKGMNKMKLIVCGRAEDIEQMIAPLVVEKGEKLKITVYPEPIVENEPHRFYVEVERNKKMEKRGEC